MNKKGFAEEGIKFNLKMVSMIILFLVVIAVAMILLFPKLTPDKSAETTSSFGKYIWDTLVGAS